MSFSLENIAEILDVGPEDPIFTLTDVSNLVASLNKKRSYPLTNRATAALVNDYKVPLTTATEALSAKEFYVLCVDGLEWEDIVFFELTVEEAIEKSKKYPKGRLEKFILGDNGGYAPTYTYYQNGVLVPHVP
jgi:hypothetical protein